MNRFVALSVLVLLFTVSCKKIEPDRVNVLSNEAGTLKVNDIVSGTGYTPSGLMWRGMDLSYSQRLETQLGRVYHEIDGSVNNTFQIAKNHGVNIVRLRLMVNPPSYLQEASLTSVKTQALRLKALGISFFLDIHYSDNWGDPTHQSKPAAWSGLTGTSLINQATSYTTSVLNELKNQGTTPIIVEVGNEITYGMLWNDFKIDPNSTTNWSNFASLFNSLYNAVKGVDNTIKVMLHLNNHDKAIAYFSKANTYGINYDIMGFSYYSGWTGTDLNSWLTTMNTLVASYGKPIMIAETAYQFTSTDSDMVPNWWNSSYLTPGYPATTAGQLSYMSQLMWTVKGINQNKGIGVVYWAPEWVAYNGPTESDYNYGSNMDNAALFDTPYYRANIAFNAFATTGTNLIKNGTFEFEGVATATPKYWSVWSVNDYDANNTQTGNSHSGSFNGIHYKAIAYEVQTYQTITGLANGNYTVKAWVISHGGQTYCRMEAKDFGGTNLYYNIPTTGNWTQVTIANINVINHQCTVSFYSKSPGTKYLAFDDVQFYKQ